MKLKLTFSNIAPSGEPCIWWLVMITSFRVTTRYSSGLSPALRAVNTISLMCVPFAQASMILQVALSVRLLKLMSWNAALPTPPPPP